MHLMFYVLWASFYPEIGKVFVTFQKSLKFQFLLLKEKHERICGINYYKYYANFHFLPQFKYIAFSFYGKHLTVKYVHTYTQWWLYRQSLVQRKMWVRKRKGSKINTDSSFSLQQQRIKPLKLFCSFCDSFFFQCCIFFPLQL